MHSRWPFCFFWIIIFFLFGQGEGVTYGGGSLKSIESLVEKYISIEKELEKSSSPIPFYLESVISSNGSRADIYGVIRYPFPIVENEIRSSANWCDILSLHDHVRACTYEKLDNTWEITVYEVNRSKEPLVDAYQMKFSHQLLDQRPSFLEIFLACPEGPFNTTDHQFRIEAIPSNDGETFVHLKYSFNYNPLAYLAMNEYLSLFDRDKVGFSVKSLDRTGNPIYVGGLKGAIERNVARHYLALVAYMDTLNTPLAQRFEERTSRWYDLTARFKRQLFEMEKEKYLSAKRKDQENQKILQAALSK